MTETPGAPTPAARNSFSRSGMRTTAARPGGGWTASARTIPRGVSQAAFAQALAQAAQSLMPGQSFPTLPGQAAASGAPASPTLDLPNGLGPIVAQAANRYGVDPALLAAVMETESGFNAGAVSRAGARGLMQLMPATAKGLGVTDANDPLQSAMGGAKLLGQMLNKYSGNVELALAAYNAGSGAVDKYGGIPPYAETRRYVPTVLNAYDRFRQTVSTGASPAGTRPGATAPTTQATGRASGR